MALEQTVQLSAWQKLLKLAMCGVKCPVVNARELFYGTPLTGEFKGSQLDMTHCITVESMFAKSELIKVTGTGEWGFRHLIDASNMFLNCTNLTEIEGMGNWNMSNVILMDHMFQDCESLNVLDMSHWDLSSLVSADGFRARASTNTQYLLINGAALDKLYAVWNQTEFLNRQLASASLTLEATKIYRVDAAYSVIEEVPHQV